MDVAQRADLRHGRRAGGVGVGHGARGDDRRGGRSVEGSDPRPIRAPGQPVLLDGPALGRRRDRSGRHQNCCRPGAFGDIDRAGKPGLLRRLPDVSAMGFHTVLVANRGEIAVRVIRTLKAMGIRSVAVYSDADADARHVAEADVAVAIGPAAARESYLNIAKIVDAAVRTGAQAVHPGYGFLSENADFAAALEKADIAFIGPPVGAIQTMGDKIAAKGTVSAFGVPVVPGIARPGLGDDELIAAADDVGYPVLVKPSAGGGGKGMRMVEQPADLPAALVSARRESAAAFGDDTLFLERFVLRPRHIEVQVLADNHGNVVHFGERECSLQRRHQKVIEEAPSPLLDAETRARIGAAACDTARSVDYSGAGTVEFIVSADHPDEFFFMEMNTRLQVEHPVTELVTGWDLVEWQVRIAAGERLTIDQADIALRGHAIEARVYAEDPAHGFLPTGGDVLALTESDRRRRARRLRTVRRNGRGQRLRPDARESHCLRAGSGRGAANPRPSACRHRRARRRHQHRVHPLPAGRPRRRCGPTGHRTARPPRGRFRRGRTRRRAVHRRSGSPMAAALSGAGCRPVGGAVRLARRPTCAGQRPAAFR